MHIKTFIYIFLFYVYECFDCVFVLALYGCMEAREGNRTPRTVVTDSCELPFAHKELNEPWSFVWASGAPNWWACLVFFPKELILKISTRSIIEVLEEIILFVGYYCVWIIVFVVSWCYMVALTGLRQDLEFQNSPGSQVKVISNW